MKVFDALFGLSSLHGFSQLSGTAQKPILLEL